MLRHRESLIGVCEVVAEHENLKVTLQEATKGAVITGSSAFIGALLGGPIGLAIGGAVGSITSAVCSWGKYRSVVSILRNDLTPTQKRKLENSIRNIMNTVSVEDAAAFLALVLTNGDLKLLVIKEIANFLLKEISMNMVQ